MYISEGNGTYPEIFSGISPEIVAWCFSMVQVAIIPGNSMETFTEIPSWIPPDISLRILPEIHSVFFTRISSRNLGFFQISKFLYKCLSKVYLFDFPGILPKIS